LIKSVYQFEKYSFQKILMEFLKINCKRERLNILITKIWKTKSMTKHETSRLKYAPTQENVTTERMNWQAH